MTAALHAQIYNTFFHQRKEINIQQILLKLHICMCVYVLCTLSPVLTIFTCGVSGNRQFLYAI